MSINNLLYSICASILSIITIIFIAIPVAIFIGVCKKLNWSNLKKIYFILFK